MSPREKLEDIKACIEAQVHIKRAAISDHRDTERVTREIARLEERIARDTVAVQAMRDRQENWRSIVEAADQRIAELRQEELLVKNQALIDKMVELEAVLNASGVDRSALEAILEQQRRAS